MTTETKPNPATQDFSQLEALLLACPKSWGFQRNQYAKGIEFIASGYLNDDVINEYMSGKGPTLADAVADLMHKLDIAATKGKPLRTAAEVKDAVLRLIAEHDAAPASFRAAVDDLHVAGR